MKNELKLAKRHLYHSKFIKDMVLNFRELVEATGELIIHKGLKKAQIKHKIDERLAEACVQRDAAERNDDIQDRPIAAQHLRWVLVVVGVGCSPCNGPSEMYLFRQVKSIRGEIALVAIPARPGSIRHPKDARCGGKNSANPEVCKFSCTLAV